MEEALLNGNPRIVVAGSSGNRRDMSRPSTLRIMPYMMMPGDYEIAASAIDRPLSKPPKFAGPAIAPPSVQVAGNWTIEVKFLTGSATHQMTIAQDRAKLSGTHRGETISGNLTGSVEGDRVSMRSSQKIQGTSLSFQFSGKVTDDTMRGEEYGKAEWPAKRP